MLDRGSFTSSGALAREILAWLEFSPCKIIVHVYTAKQQEELYNELDGWKTMGRVRVEIVQ